MGVKVMGGRSDRTLLYITSPMKIAYVSLTDPTDEHSWSGLMKTMRNCLHSLGHEVEDIFGMKRSPLVWVAFWTFYHRYIERNHYDWRRDPVVLRNFARQVEARLAGGGFDMIFSPGTSAVALLETDIPIVIWTDATFENLVGFYPENSNHCAATVREGHQVEKRILGFCKYAIYPSEWAARSAIDFYGADPAKVKIIPFGASVESTRDLDSVRQSIAARSRQNCQLLFVGVNWHRKGGEKALEVARLLNEAGIPTELHVVGAGPDGETPEFVKRHGYISKRTPEGRAKLDALFASSHFLIVPSLAECFGLVFADASAHGVPSLATNVGGIPAVVRDGINGRVFDLDEHAATYRDHVLRLFADWPHYEALAESSFREYSDRLNWDTVGRIFAGVLAGVQTEAKADSPLSECSS
jgi:glycosyltransferase involved in cell wall biosynthesis